MTKKYKKKSHSDTEQLLDGVAEGIQTYIVNKQKKNKKSSDKDHSTEINLLKDFAMREAEVNLHENDAVFKDTLWDLPHKSFRKLLNPNIDNAKPPGFLRRNLGNAMPWLFSKGVTKAVNIAIPIVAIAGIGSLSGGIVPFVALGIAGGTMLFNTIRDTRSLRALKNLEEEHNLLAEHREAQALGRQANHLVKSKTNVDLIGPPDVLKEPNTQTFKPEYEDNLTSRSLAKTIRGAIVESLGSIATVSVVATSGLANAAMHAISFGTTSAVFGIADIALTTINRRKINIIKNSMRKNIDEWRKEVPAYSDLQTLRALTREQQIKTAALVEVAKSNLSADDLQNGLNASHIGVSEKFTIPEKPSFWKRTTDYFKDFNSVNWPNAYSTAERLASKLDEDAKSQLDKYNQLSQGIQKLVKQHEESKTWDAHDMKVMREVVMGRKKVADTAKGHSVI